jgi:hypothetical protein
LKAFRVNEAAAEVGRSEVDNMTAKSNAEVFLTPQCTPVKAYPFGNSLSGSGPWRWAFEGMGLEWYVSGLLDEEGILFQMIGSVRGRAIALVQAVDR